MSWSRYLNDKMPCILASASVAVTLGTPLQAQDKIVENPFFGFEFVMTPIATKWVCGGERDKDLAQIQRLIDAFPEEANAAEISSSLAVLQNVDALSDLLGATINDANTIRLCSAAMPLNLDWATHENLASGTDTMPPDQEKAWRVFYETVESL